MLRSKVKELFVRTTILPKYTKELGLSGRSVSNTEVRMAETVSIHC